MNVPKEYTPSAPHNTLFIKPALTTQLPRYIKEVIKKIIGSDQILVDTNDSRVQKWAHTNEVFFYYYMDHPEKISEGHPLAGLSKAQIEEVYTMLYKKTPFSPEHLLQLKKYDF